MRNIYIKMWIIAVLLFLFYFIFIFQDGYRAKLILEGLIELILVFFKYVFNKLLNSINF